MRVFSLPGVLSARERFRRWVVALGVFGASCALLAHSARLVLAAPPAEGSPKAEPAKADEKSEIKSVIDANDVAHLADGQTLQLEHWGETYEGYLDQPPIHGEDAEPIAKVGGIATSIALDTKHKKIYWTNYASKPGDSSILRSDLDGGKSEIVVNGLTEPHTLAIDVVHEQLYWSSTDSGDKPIFRIAPTRGAKEEIVNGIVNGIWGLALDDRAEGFYYGLEKKLFHCDLDGSNERLITSEVAGKQHPNSALFLSAEANQVFFSVMSTDCVIGAFSIDKMEFSTRITVKPHGRVFGLAVDDVRRKVYWTDKSYGAIRRANVDGTQVEDVVVGLFEPFDVKLDLDRNMIYWSGNGSVSRAKLPPVRETIRFRAPPIVARISPSIAAPDDVVSLQGKNLCEVIDVQFIDAQNGKNVSARFTERNCNELCVTMPTMHGMKHTVIIVQTKGGVTVTVSAGSTVFLNQEMRIEWEGEGKRRPHPSISGIGIDDCFPGAIRPPRGDPRCCWIAGNQGRIEEIGRKIAIALPGGYVRSNPQGQNSFFIKSGGIALPGSKRPSNCYYEPWAVIPDRRAWNPQARVDHLFIPVPAIRLSVLDMLLAVKQQ